MKKPTKTHEMIPVPTAYEESEKIIDRKDVSIITQEIEKRELERYRKDQEAILMLLNNESYSKFPLVDKIALEQATYEEAIKNLVSLKNTEILETMMLLYEYMGQKKTFKLDKITGTELLKLAGYTQIRQKHRSSILEKILLNSHSKLSILKPEKSIKNLKNKSTEKGLVYQHYDLIKIKETVRSKKNPNLIVELTGVEFLPEYINHIHKISKRYLPLKTIRKIPKECRDDKSRYFLYKLCFKFAGMKKNFCQLDLDECMNLGKFFNKRERSMMRKWQPIEKALIRAKQANLIDYRFIFREVSKNEIKKDNLIVNTLNEIEIPEFDEENGVLKTKFYKYIHSVSITRIYDLQAPIMELPYELEKTEPTKDFSHITF